MRQDAVTVSMSDEVPLNGQRRKFRLTLTMDYRRRVVADRRLLITVNIEELREGTVPLKLPFRSDARAADDHFECKRVPRDVVAVIVRAVCQLDRCVPNRGEEACALLVDARW